MNLNRYGTHKAVVRAVAEVSAERLRDWALKGWIRSAKLGASKQASRVYHLDDFREVIERLAKGCHPKQRRLPQRRAE